MFHTILLAVDGSEYVRRLARVLAEPGGAVNSKGIQILVACEQPVSTVTRRARALIPANPITAHRLSRASVGAS